MPSPAVKISLAAALYGGVVALTLLPPGAETPGAAGLVALLLVVVAIPVAGWVRTKVRLGRAHQARRQANLAAFWTTLAEISWLEDLHLQPATEPNRSTYIRTRGGS